MLLKQHAAEAHAMQLANALGRSCCHQVSFAVCRRSIKFATAAGSQAHLLAVGTRQVGACDLNEARQLLDLELIVGLHGVGLAGRGVCKGLQRVVVCSSWGMADMCRVCRLMLLCMYKDQAGAEDV